MNGSILVRLGTIAALALLGACASSGSQVADHSAADPDYLAERALQRWNLLIGGRADQAYDFLSPGTRELKSREAYVAEIAVRPVNWVGAEPVSVECFEADGFCDVTSNIRFKVPSSLPGVGKIESSSPVVERWIRSGTDWYLVPQDVARR